MSEVLSVSAPERHTVTAHDDYRSGAGTKSALLGLLAGQQSLPPEYDWWHQPFVPELLREAK
jgi:hypothetical protein